MKKQLIPPCTAPSPLLFSHFLAVRAPPFAFLCARHRLSACTCVGCGWDYFTIPFVNVDKASVVFKHFVSKAHWMISQIHTGGLCDTCHLIPLCTFSSLNGVWVSMGIRNYLNWPLGTPVCFVTPFGNHRSHYNQFIYATKQYPVWETESK